MEKSTFLKIGYIVVILIFLTALFYTLFLSRGAVIGTSDVRKLTVAHWQLEDGFREGMDAVIKQFEKLKAKEGVRVKIYQSTVPWRGYSQWQTTQLIGGNPVDIMEMQWNWDLNYQYFTSVLPYIGKPNKYNKGTILEGMPWKDSMADGMRSGINPKYNDYLRVGFTSLSGCVLVNLELLEKATGSRKLPENIGEYIEDCKKIMEYSKKVKDPIRPIAIRGIDKKTLFGFLEQFFSEMNGYLNDEYDRYYKCDIQHCDIFKGIKNGKLNIERLYAAVALCKEIGEYFGEGFTAMDLEQAKYLYFNGNIGFFPTGTYNALSLIQNSPFETGVFKGVPVGYEGHKYSKYFTGRENEANKWLACSFGVTKASEHKELAVEFIQYLTSYEANQTFNMYPKWGPGVKFADYEKIGYYEELAPNLEGNRHVFKHPFFISGDSSRKAIQLVEDIIINQIDNPVQYFIEKSFEYKDIIVNELKEIITSEYRVFGNQEAQRSQTALGFFRKSITDHELKILKNKYQTVYEGYSTEVERAFNNQDALKYFELIQPEDLRTKDST